jgi:hypothetical protein
MRYLKTYEAINDNLQIGDYVICKTDTGDEKILNFLENNIGQYVRYITNKKEVVDNFRYVIEYNNIPFELSNYSYTFSYEIDIPNICMRVDRDEIIFNSKNKEDLEAIIQSKKYNL